MNKPFRLHLHPLTIPILGLFIACCPELFSAHAAALLTAILMHEAGHCLVLAAYRIPIRSMTLSPLGATMSVDFSKCSYFAETAVHSAGIAVNFVCAFLFWMIDVETAIYPSLVLGFYNLLPLSSFDGGKLLRSILLNSTHWSAVSIERFCQTVSYLTLGILYCISGFAMWFFSLRDPGGTTLLYCAFFTAVWGGIYLRTAGQFH